MNRVVPDGSRASEHAANVRRTPGIDLPCAAVEHACLGDCDQCEGRLRRNATRALLACVVQEVSQPIAALDTAARAAMNWLDGDAPDIDEARRMLALIGRSAEQVGLVVRAMRTHARDTEPADASFDLVQAMQEASQQLSPTLQRMGVNLCLRQLGSSIQVRGDRQQLKHVAIDLLMNGAEAMLEVPPGKRHLSISCVSCGSRVASVVVDDTGAGINSALAARLGEPFFTTKVNRMGLGLARSRAILDAHCGTLMLTQRERVGTRAVFTLPRIDD